MWSISVVRAPKQMITIHPKSFCGPRAYFADFDHQILFGPRNSKATKLKAERKLKTLLLLKGQIVCAASHLSTPFAYKFFTNNPLLLTSGAIAPAFRSDKKDIAELFTKKRFREKQSAILFFKDHIQKTVTWHFDDNLMWFRGRFLKDVEDDRSLISTQISPETRPMAKRLAAEIEKGSFIGGEFIDRAMKGLPRQDKRLLRNYLQLLYHMSGARIVHCESALPQENYIDYDIADLQHKRARLSEPQILSKVLLELVFDSLQKSMMPVELLDVLTFEDILQIRQPLLESSFQHKYDALVGNVVGAHESKASAVFDIDKLEAIRKHLSENFDNVLQKELPRFLKKKALEHSKELASVSSSVALGVAGAVPGVGLVARAESVMKDTPASFVNIGQTYRSIRSISKQDEYYQNKEQLIKTEIKKSGIGEKAALYEMVDLLLSVISKRTQLQE